VDLDTQARLAAARLPHPRAARAVVRLGCARPYPRGCVLGTGGGRQPTTSRATGSGSCTCMLPPHGCRCSFTW
jgi:hypothetical protein